MRIDVKKGHIKQITFNRDDDAGTEWKELVVRLKGQRYDTEALRNALAGLDLVPYFGEITIERFMEYIY